jgi:hypothetical protein
LFWNTEAFTLFAASLYAGHTSVLHEASKKELILSTAVSSYRKYNYLSLKIIFPPLSVEQLPFSLV